MTHDVDIAIVGAGVVGLAIARALAATHSVVVLEKNARSGDETSSRNSGVIHAGIYYPPQSLKARLCVRGRQLLYDYCTRHAIAHQRCGKLIVATTEREVAALRTLQQQAHNNGVTLHWWDQPEIQQAEPAIAAVAALFSPDTGIVDAPALVQQLSADVLQAGGDIVTHCQVESIAPTTDGFVLHALSNHARYRLRARRVINAAGLHAQQLAANIHGLATRHIPPLYWCKGDYFRLRKGAPFSHLIYPVVDPHAPGLGIHATLDLAGTVSFGPDAHYVDTLDYAVDAHKRAVFCQAIARYFPSITPHDLEPDYAGIRPKLQAAGAPWCDFVISGSQQHGISGLINLFGIESPGLTASLAIAEHIATLTAAEESRQ